MRTRTCSVILVLSLALLALACGPATQAPERDAGGGEPAAPPSPTTAALPAAPLPTETAQSAPESPSPATTAAAPTAPLHTITIVEPLAGAKIHSPVRIRGTVSISPFESTLRAQVYDASGRVAGVGPIMTNSEMGQPGEFDGTLAFESTAGGAGRIEIAEISPKDGGIVASAYVDVLLAPGQSAGAIAVPAPGQRVVLPLRIMARLGQAGEQVQASLRWEDGTLLEHTFTLLPGEDGRGLLIDSLNWPGESWPPEPPTQPAALEIRDAAGTLLARQDLTVLSPSDPDTQQITLYFLLGEELQAVQQRIPRTERIGTAALEELLWGPAAPNLAGFGTAIPLPADVLSFPGRGAGWGPRVTLLSLTISDGIALADFSREMNAYGGGSLRVMTIRKQIEQTLKQFATVQQVVVAVEGDTETALQP